MTRLTLFLILMLLVAPGWAAVKKTEMESYRYAHNEAEYIVTLPEAPRARTIWSTDAAIPYVGRAVQNGAIGEIATFRRIDPETEDIFDVTITFLKADESFLKSLTPETMRATLENEFKGIPLESIKAGFSAGKNPALRWATFNGFSVDDTGRPFYNVGHYLTGAESILVIRIRYNIENKTFAHYYKTLVDTITYQPL